MLVPQDIGVVIVHLSHVALSFEPHVSKKSCTVSPSVHSISSWRTCSRTAILPSSVRPQDGCGLATGVTSSSALDGTCFLLFFLAIDYETVVIAWLSFHCASLADFLLSLWFFDFFLSLGRPR